jgi:hypothetical protein
VTAINQSNCVFHCSYYIIAFDKTSCPRGAIQVFAVDK